MVGCRSQEVIMNQKILNDFLKKTQETYDYLMAHDKQDEAREVLRTGSVMAEFALKVMNVKNLPMKCPYGHRIKGKIAQEAWIKHNICLDCDHLLTDRHFEEET